MLSAMAAAAASAQDIDAGKLVFHLCASCHSTTAINGQAPGLQGVLGRSAGRAEGFRFSRAMRSAGYAWDVARLDAYIQNPQAAMPGNVMPFSGLEDPKQRADLIAYLSTLK